MNLIFFVQAFFGTVIFLLLCIILFERFILSGQRYRGDKMKQFKNGMFTLGELFDNDKGFKDILKWNTNRNSTPWNNPYSSDTIVLTPFDATTYSVRSTFINHATVLIETKDYTLLTDPIFSKYASPFSFMGPARHHDPYLSLAKIPKVDFVLISHAHYDHLSIESIKMIEEKFKPTYIVPLNNGQFMERAGISKERIIELNIFENYTTPDKHLHIVLDEAKHWSARGFSDRRRYLWGSYIIETQNKRLFFAGDSGYDRHFADIKKRYGTIDAAFLPIGAYEPRWFMKDFHMNPEEAVQAAQDLNNPQVMSIHFGTFKLTDEGRYEPERKAKAILTSTPYDNTFLVPTIQNGLQLFIK